MKPQLLKAVTLETLAELQEPATERMLILAVRVSFGARLTYSDLRSTLDTLEQERAVVGITSEDGDARWKITDDGRARLAECRS